MTYFELSSPAGSYGEGRSNNREKTMRHESSASSSKESSTPDVDGLADDLRPKLSILDSVPDSVPGSVPDPVPDSVPLPLSLVNTSDSARQSKVHSCIKSKFLL